jgi:MATE family multidrug resistance protein
MERRMTSLSLSKAPSRAITRAPAQGGSSELIRLAYPIVLTQLSMSAMQIVDTAMVGRLGPSELGAVGFGGIWMWTALTLFVGTTQGIQTFVAQDCGAGREAGTGAWFWQGAYVVLPLTVLAIATFALCMPAFLDWLAPPREIRPLTTLYVQARAWGSPAGVAFVMGAAFFRGTGNTRTPLYLTLFAVGVNAVLDYGLIFGRLGLPELGVQGAGYATAIANWLGAISIFAALMRQGVRRRYATSWTRPETDSMIRFLRTSAPVGAQWLLGMSSFAVFSTLVAHMGSTSIAASQALIAVLSVSIMLASGLSIASATLVGQYVGARNWVAAERAHRSAIRIGFIVSLGLAALFVAAPGFLIRLFTEDSELLEAGASLMLVGAVLQVFDTMVNISSGSLRGAGDTRWPLMATTGLAWLVYLPLAYFLGITLEGGLLGAWAGCAVNSGLAAMTLLARFRRGTWQTITI